MYYGIMKTVNAGHGRNVDCQKFPNFTAQVVGMYSDMISQIKEGDYASHTPS